MALITPAQVREHFAALIGPAEDALLATLIQRADRAMAAHCSRPETDTGIFTFESATYTRKIGRPWAGDVRRLDVGVRPIIGVSSVTIDDSPGSFTYTTTVPSTDYEIDPRPGHLWLKSTATAAWITSPLGNKIVCTAGFAATPDDLIYAAAAQVVHLNQLRKSQGLQNVGDVTRAVGPDQVDFHIPPMVQALLGPYVLWENRLG